MNRRDRDQLLSTFLWILLCCLLLGVLAWWSGCSTLKSAASGAIGAGIGFVAPPFGPVVGAGIGAAIGSMLAVNDALVVVASRRTALAPPPPWFLRWEMWAFAGLALFLFRNREHVFTFLKASKGTRLKTATRGLLHSVVGGKVGKPHTG